MKFNEDDLQSNIMDLIQEREKYRMQALKYKEALQRIADYVGDHAQEVAEKALEGDDDV